MEIKQLRTFVEVARSRSVSSAARKLHYAQSTVTEQVRDLEAWAGVPLLIRTSRGVYTTAAGERLLGYACSILTLVDNARQQCHAFRGERVAVTRDPSARAIHHSLKNLD